MLHVIVARLLLASSCKRFPCQSSVAFAWLISIFGQNHTMDIVPSLMFFFLIAIDILVDKHKTLRQSAMTVVLQ